MKGDELRARRNFHVSKRISNRLERQYGIILDHPTARETVNPIIDSLRRSRNVTHRDTLLSPPVETSTAVHSSTLSNRRSFLQRFNCISEKPDKYESWLVDDYLFLQIGSVSSGTQVRRRPSKHRECEEPECGSAGWQCDLCQEVGLTNEPIALEEAELPLPSEDRQSKSKKDFTLQRLLDVCPVAASIRALRREKRLLDEIYFVPELFEIPTVPVQEWQDQPGISSSVTVDVTTLPPADVTVTPAGSSLVIADITSPSVDAVIPAIPGPDFDDCLFVLALVLHTCMNPTLSHTPGIDELAAPTGYTSEAAYDDCVVNTMEAKNISVTSNGQNFIFDRGKVCPCVLWLSRDCRIVVT